MNVTRLAAVAASIGAMASLSGCLSGGGSSGLSNGSDPDGSNKPPSISGIAPDSVVVGDAYTFNPSASDADGDTLTFSVQNLPGWASFDTSSGEITGIPGAGTEGEYTGIRIVVSDGTDSVMMDPFSIEVVQVGLGSVVLSWDAPTQNTDGSQLTDLAAFNIYYGGIPGNYPNQIRIENPTVTTYVVDNLVPDTYYFVATAENEDGLESAYSDVAEKVVTAD